MKCAREGCDEEAIRRKERGPVPLYCSASCKSRTTGKRHRIKHGDRLNKERRDQYRENPELQRLAELKYRLTRRGQIKTKEERQRRKMMRQFNSKIRLAIRIVLKEVTRASEEGLTALRFLRQHIDGLIVSFETQMGTTEKKRPYAESSWVAEKRQSRKEAAEFAVSLVPRDAPREERLEAAKVALSLYDSVKVLGRSIGDVWYSELEAMRKESLFGAALADQLIQHGIPNKPTRIRDFVNQKTLANMVAHAQRNSADLRVA